MWVHNAEVYLEPIRTSEMEFFQKSSIVDVSLGSKYASVMCRHLIIYLCLLSVFSRKCLTQTKENKNNLLNCFSCNTICSHLNGFSFREVTILRKNNTKSMLKLKDKVHVTFLVFLHQANISHFNIMILSISALK